MKRLPAFTLIEILLVIGIIGILASVVILAINPTDQLNTAEGVNRNVAVREIKNAAVQYVIDGNTLSGLPTTIGTAKDICRDSVTGTDCTDAPVSGYDLSALVPSYMTSLPVDPDETDANITGYMIYMDGSFITVCSPVLDASCGS